MSDTKSNLPCAFSGSSAAQHVVRQKSLEQSTNKAFSIFSNSRCASLLKWISMSRLQGPSEQALCMSQYLQSGCPSSCSLKVDLLPAILMSGTFFCFLILVTLTSIPFPSCTKIPSGVNLLTTYSLRKCSAPSVAMQHCCKY